MADNINASATGVNLASDEIAGVHYPRSKIGYGADGAYQDATTDQPFPVAVDGVKDAAAARVAIPADGLAVLDAVRATKTKFPKGGKK